jgi:hypothetical protein
LRPLRPSAGIGEQSFALQQVIGRSLPAGQGIVTFFTIFLPFVYCSALELSTAVVIFPADPLAVILSYATQCGKDQIVCRPEHQSAAVSSLHVIDDGLLDAETGDDPMMTHGSRRGSAPTMLRCDPGGAALPPHIIISRRI